jgi:heme exporter protein D
MSDSKNEIRKGFYYPTETYYFYITLISIILLLIHAIHHQKIFLASLARRQQPEAHPRKGSDPSQEIKYIYHIV